MEKVTVVTQKQDKDYSFQANILELVLDCLDKGVVPNPKVIIKYLLDTDFKGNYCSILLMKPWT